MRQIANSFLLILFIVVLPGCAGVQRELSSCSAGMEGADWVVVQYTFDGHPFRCWELHGASVVNEASSDGIYWTNPSTNNLVHISGIYNRVQVTNDNWDKGFQEVGLTQDGCNELQSRTYDPTTGEYADKKSDG